MDAPVIDSIELELLLEGIFLKYQYDFRHYSRASLKRRLVLAIERLGCQHLSELQGRVLRDPSLFTRLLNYLTVATTEMFRDPSFFLGLRQRVVPYLRTYPSLKVWVAGCSTGEEVYSLAILLRECGLLKKTLLYATDINPASLEMARIGVYRAEALQQASRNYQLAGGTGSLADHYSAAYDAVKFDPELVRSCVFSDHSLATDSVFAEVHLVTCRNVLIYFDRQLQHRAFGLFKDALVRHGFLGLGSKETINFSSHRKAFEPMLERERIYRRV
jgi:chemotaxis protein methyltransferase CheR